MRPVNLNIGIVVPTRNRPENVKNLLASIEKSTIYPTRCIIVDSSDFQYDLPAFSFPVLLVTSKLLGQVNQRNYGVRLLSERENVDYVFTLDDDIVLEPRAIGAALEGIQKFESMDQRFVGFALNIVNSGGAGNVYRRIMLYPKVPGAVTRSAFNSSLASLERDIECDWVIGGAAVWRMEFISRNPSDYPFAGKAYAEDLYYCSKMRFRARFGAICNARCLHIDHYGIRELERTGYATYLEGLNEAKVRIHIARMSPQYCVFLTVLHTVWTGLLGIGYGIVFLDRVAFFLGLGRVASIKGLTQWKRLSLYVSK